MSTESEEDTPPNSPNEPEVNILPVIEPIGKQRTKRRYTMTEKAKAQSAVKRERMKQLNAENRRKLREYESLVQVRGISKQDVEALLNAKFNELEQKIVSTTKQPELPKLIAIPEESQEFSDGYSSGGTKRTSSRFKRAEITVSERFRRF